MNEHLAIGLMSGSSLDGVDLALVRFRSEASRYRFEILKAATLPYPPSWAERLSQAFHKHPEELSALDKEYGCFLGDLVLQFTKQCPVTPDFIASHGHTIFHKPENHYTLQIGDGQCIADRCGLTVINDFRTEDVSKGGQGAPLVPIGDQLLFGEYEACLNIGGIANVSYDKNGRRIAYDICIANQALNYLSQREGFAYDEDGRIASIGTIDKPLLARLNDNPFFHQSPPKSLGREFFETRQKPMLDRCTTADLLATFVEHIAMQVANALQNLPTGKLLVTGGGAFNKYLVGRIQSHTQHEVIIPDTQVIAYKEALIFAFLGLLRLKGRPNVLASVTGASSDSCSGRFWTPNNNLAHF